MNTKKDFLDKSLDVISTIYDQMENLEPLKICNLDIDKTALIIVDMINGFVKSGPLSSERVLAINDSIAFISKQCSKLGIKKVSFADSHTKDSPEFSNYPIHCLKGDKEAKVTDEIQNSGEYLLIEKNSTNSFLEPKFDEWLKNNREIDTFIIVGCCTDICVNQFALTLKAEFNRLDKQTHIFVPIDSVETYDMDKHYAPLINIMSLYNMSINGIDLISKIEF